jgi:NADH-quinone oxidoreductase subunit L
VSWVLYGRKGLEKGQPDVLAKPLGPLYTGMENKWFIDEAYQFLVILPYMRFSRFLAEKVDWLFWHDFIHDRVIVGGYNALSRKALNEYADQRGINAFFDGLGNFIKEYAIYLRSWQNGLVRSYALTVLAGLVVILGFLGFLIFR